MFSKLAEAADIYLLVTVVREPDEVFRTCQADADKSSAERWMLNNCLTWAKNFNKLLRSFCNERKRCQDSKDLLTGHFVPVKLLLSNWKEKIGSRFEKHFQN